jgi:hypothetical protein
VLYGGILPVFSYPDFESGIISMDLLVCVASWSALLVKKGVYSTALRQGFPISHSTIDHDVQNNCQQEAWKRIQVS